MYPQFRRALSVLLLIYGVALTAPAQHIYNADISKTATSVLSGHLKLGRHINAAGDSLGANSLYFTKNGRPWYPVMGEAHFSRYPREQWEEAILKMKGAGIDIIATYVFWIYHEEQEGLFNWTGNNDLRAFAELCQKHHVFLWVRIGPWCHGEVRNGGFPDWLVKRGNTRKNDPAYLASVQTFYTQVAAQLKGLYFKDNGPIIGVQIENEFRFNNPAGLEHMLTLKKMAVTAGMDVPYYTATGWQGANLKQDELIPVWGAYPEAPWSKQTTKLPLSENYLFSSLRSDPAIGNDLPGHQQEVQADFKGYRYPYATAEMGAGNQVTYHRRPIIEANDVTALAYVKIGSGANLMGYYMFEGGSNAIGKLSTLQESKATKYANDYPIISYDFQSPIGESGWLRPSYKAYKIIHTFLSEFGDKLVQYSATFPEEKPAAAGDNSVLRWSVRSGGSSGFIFISNYQRQLEPKDFTNVQFRLKTTDNTFVFPKIPVTIAKGLQAILPFNMELEGALLKYATTQPLCRIAVDKNPLYVFFAPEGLRPEYVFDKKTIARITCKGGKVSGNGDQFMVINLTPGQNCIITILLKNGKSFNILTLTHELALHANKITVAGREFLFISPGAVLTDDKGLRIQNFNDPPVFNWLVYPKLNLRVANTRSGIFTNYRFDFPVKPSRASAEVRYKEITDISSYLNRMVNMPLDDRDSLSGLQYQTMLTPVDGVKQYEITLPEWKDNSHENYLFISYAGSTAALYLDGQLVADDFYNGLPMIVSLKKFGSLPNGKKWVLQIVPVRKEEKIYFEDTIKNDREAIMTGLLKSMTVFPQYELNIAY